MSRFLSLFLLAPLVLLAPITAQAADEEPTIQNKTLSEWIERLRGEQAKIDRLTLLQALGSSAAHPAAWRWQVQQREAGALAVSLIGPQKSPKVFPALLAALRDDPEESIRRTAAQLLGRLGGRVNEDNREKRAPEIKLDDVRNGLVTALRSDKSARVREGCARALGQLKESANPAVPALARALKDPSEETQASAAESLRILGRTLAVRDELPQLEEALKDPKTATIARVQIVSTIGIVGRMHPINLSVLLDVLKNPKEPEELRKIVVETVGYLNKTESVAVLTDVLKEDPSLELRRACLTALDNFGPAAKPALEELKKGLYDKDKFVRTMSMHAIGRIGKDLGPESKAIVKELIKISNEPILEVRVSAIETLGNLGAEAIGDDMAAVQEQLAKLEKDEQRLVRESAQEAKKKLKP